MGSLPITHTPPVTDREDGFGTAVLVGLLVAVDVLRFFLLILICLKAYRILLPHPIVVDNRLADIVCSLAS